MERLRNAVVYHVGNFLINRVAVGEYRQYLRAVCALGIQQFDAEFWKLYEQKQEETEQRG